MKLRVDRITDETTAAQFAAPVAELNERLDRGGAHDFHLVQPLAVDVRYYRTGEELFFAGHCETVLEGVCARCLETFSLPLATPFEFVLSRAQPHESAQELHTEDLAFSFYSGDEIDLTPLVGEQAILALPSRAVCREECRGLCPSCGTNRNEVACGCKETSTDPRLAVLVQARARTAS